MNCSSCNSERVASVNSHCSDMCNISLAGKDHDGYVPKDMGIGGGDDVEFEYCLDCGKIQGKFPLPETKLETPEEDE